MVSFDVPDIKWIERFIVGSSDPRNPLTEAEIASQLDRINAELRFGKIVSIETNLNSGRVDNVEIITQYTVYHIGYKSRPHGK